MKCATVISIKIKSRNALLRMLLVCIGSSLKSVLIYTVSILDTYHPDTLYLSEQVCEGPWLFFETKKGSASKQVWETLTQRNNNRAQLPKHHRARLTF